MYLQAAADLVKTMISKFWDTQNGGFFQTQNAPAGMPRIKQLYDGAAPSGNSIALHDLLWLSRLANEPMYEQMATQMTKTFAEEMEGAPEAYTFFFRLLISSWVHPTASPSSATKKKKDTNEMVSALRRLYLPTTVVALKHPDKTELGYKQIDGKATAYVCRDQTCLPATNNVSEMLRQLDVKAK